MRNLRFIVCSNPDDAVRKALTPLLADLDAAGIDVLGAGTRPRWSHSTPWWIAAWKWPWSVRLQLSADG